MFKKLLEIFLLGRLNAIEKDIEILVDAIQNQNQNQKGSIAKLVAEIDPMTLKNIDKLKSKIILYGIVFGSIYEEGVTK